MTKHRHTIDYGAPGTRYPFRDQPFVQCLDSAACDPMSHGDRVLTETCCCGAKRQVNSRGGIYEEGSWDDSGSVSWAVQRLDSSPTNAAAVGASLDSEASAPVPATEGG